jgi:hypothetical protein
MWMRLPIGRPKRHISRLWPQTEQEDQRPIATYLWDWVAAPHATVARAYIEYSNEMGALVPSCVSICSSFLTFCYFMVVITPMSFETYIYSGYLDVVRVAKDDGAPRKSWTQPPLPPRPDFVDDTMSNYLLPHRGVSPSCTGDVTIQDGATNTS